MTPSGHQLAAFSQTHALVDVHHFGAGVAAQDFIWIARGHTITGFRLTKDRGHVSEIELVVRIVVAQFVDM